MIPPDGQRRIVIHAGFHRTGTTTVQRVLAKNRDILAPFLQVILKEDIAAICSAAGRYARVPRPSNLAKFAQQVGDHFAGLDPADARPILLSAEDLCGPIPGRRGRAGYPHAPDLLKTLIAGLPPTLAPHVFLSTRDFQSWQHSCYAHHLRYSQMQDSLQTYLDDQSASNDLEGQAQDIRAALEDTPVTTRAIEDMANLPQGPLTPLLDLVDLPADQRAPLRPRRALNRSMPPDILKQFLLVNRTEHDPDTCKAAKFALVAAYKKGTA
ncbi:MAG: hypothetical protein ACSHW1_00525 [Yoonia sp.]|uniref:hypothetical protein n=1 Tax=Yoonia sp. TaxID=2212373 RepID=UPI003EF5AA26